jgi:serine/threonine protein kinase
MDRNNTIEIIKNGKEIYIECSECANLMSYHPDFTKTCPNIGCSTDSFLIENKYAILNFITSGGFGSIYKVLKLDDKMEYALKIRLNEQKIDESFNKEIEVHKSIQKIPHLITTE